MLSSRDAAEPRWPNRPWAKSVEKGVALGRDDSMPVSTTGGTSILEGVEWQLRAELGGDALCFCVSDCTLSACGETRV